MEEHLTLSSINSRFCCKLLAVYGENKINYILTENMFEITLFSLLQSNNKLEDEYVLFYGGCVVLISIGIFTFIGYIVCKFKTREFSNK